VTVAVTRHLVCVLAAVALGCLPAVAHAQPWALDRWAPVPAIAGGPNGQTTADSATFGVSATEESVTQVYADAPPASPLYAPAGLAFQRGVLTGYACGGASEPCDDASRLYFRPSLTLGRGAFARAVTLAAGWTDSVSGETFEDVPQSNALYTFVERAVLHGAMSGYPCGAPPAGACNAQNEPYFDVAGNASRGDVTKALDAASQFTDSVSGQTYTDVTGANALYTPVQRLTALGIVSGYACGTSPAGACDMQNRPYFLPANTITRGEIVTELAALSRTPQTLSCSLAGATQGIVGSGACAVQASYTGLAHDDYTFTLTATDQLGNHASATRQFSVVAQSSPTSTPVPTGTPAPIATATPTPLPSNHFALGSPARCAKACHTIRLTVTLAGPGTVSAQSSQTKPVALAAAKAGPVTLKLIPTKAAAKLLKRKGKLKVKVRVTFRPTGGTAAGHSTVVTFKR
jgi:hypothetical protein